MEVVGAHLAGLASELRRLGPPVDGSEAQRGLRSGLPDGALGGEGRPAPLRGGFGGGGKPVGKGTQSVAMREAPPPGGTLHGIRALTVLQSRQLTEGPILILGGGGGGEEKMGKNEIKEPHFLRVPPNLLLDAPPPPRLRFSYPPH